MLGPALLVPVLFAAPAGTAPPEPIAAYAVVAPSSVAESNLVARAVMPQGAQCPSLVVKRTTQKGRLATKALPMKVRRPARAALPAFDSVVVCSRDLPTIATKATIAGSKIPAAMPARITKMALLADTGCRVKGSAIQDCNSPSAWPLRRIAKRIKAAAPDVVLNPGDYYYREQACPPADDALCGGTPPPVPGMPFTDSADGWLVDVINPMRPMFSTAPMALLRGNHEACDRGGNGFFLFFDPRPDTAGLCGPVDGAAPPPATTPTWSVTLQVRKGRTLRLAMVDSAYGQDSTVDSWARIQRPTYAAARRQTTPKHGRQSWLLTHRPVFSHVTDTFAPGQGPLWTPWGSLDQTAASQGLLDTYQLILSSHVHVTQAVQIPGQPGSLIMGNGGTLLDPATGYNLPQYGPLVAANGQPVDPAYAPYPNATMDWTRVEFGYAIAKPVKKTGWSIVHRDPQGKRFGSCSVGKRRIACS